MSEAEKMSAEEIVGLSSDVITRMARVSSRLMLLSKSDGLEVAKNMSVKQARSHLKDMHWLLLVMDLNSENWDRFEQNIAEAKEIWDCAASREAGE